MLHAHDVSVQIGGAQLLQGVTTCVRPGEVIALIGPNGAGKSTLLSVLAGDRRPTQGQITLDERPLTKWPMDELARRRTVVPQSSSLSFPFAVEEVVTLGRMPHSHSSSAARDHQIVAAALRRVSLWERRRQLYTTLSGGERQRVHIARAIAQLNLDLDADEPEATTQGDEQARYLLLDEPTASLDPAHAVEVLTFVRSIAAMGVGVMVVLHELNLASLFADRVILMHQGKKLADGAPSQVVNSDTLSDAFGHAVRVATHPDCGVPIVLPPRPDHLAIRG